MLALSVLTGKHKGTADNIKVESVEAGKVGAQTFSSYTRESADTMDNSSRNRGLAVVFKVSKAIRINTTPTTIRINKGDGSEIMRQVHYLPSGKSREIT